MTGRRVRSDRSTVESGQIASRSLVLGNADLVAVHQQGLPRIQAQPLEVELLDVVIEAVLLRRLDRVELVDLHEVQTAHVRLVTGIDTAGFQQLPRLRIVPGRDEPVDPLDEVLGRLAGRQRDDAARMVLHPLHKPHGHQLAQRREIAHRDDRDLLFRGVQRIERRVLDRVAFHRRIIRLLIDAHRSSLRSHGGSLESGTALRAVKVARLSESDVRRSASRACAWLRRIGNRCAATTARMRCHICGATFPRSQV